MTAMNETGTNAEEQEALAIAAAIVAGERAQAEAVNHRLRFHRLRHFLRVRKAKLFFLIMATRFYLAVRRGQVKEVWAGDSNSQLIPDTRMGAPLRHVADGVWACHLGPRLQYSIATKGLNPAFVKVLARIGRLKGARDIVWIYSFGEIDVRCKLVPKMDQPGTFDFTTQYLERMREVARVSGVDRIVILVPHPESDIALEQIGFPVVGTLEERVECMRRLHAAMHASAAQLSAGTPRVLLMDNTAAMSDERGVWLRDYTYDGLHTNNAGRALVRSALAELIAADEAAHPRS
jgi:lysophospholipase L1-like esterase